jgi:hypothetical protein
MNEVTKQTSPLIHPFFFKKKNRWLKSKTLVGVRGVDIWRDSYRDVHNLSGALKLFLREIPGGVIPFDRYDRFLAVNGKYTYI